MKASYGWIARDVALGSRRLMRTPSTMLMSTVALALGISAVASVAKVADGLLYRPPGGVTDPATLVAVVGDDVATPESEREAFSYPQFLELQAKQRSLASLAGSIRLFGVFRTGDGGSKRIKLEFASTNYFALQGVQAALGRTLADRDDQFSQPGIRIAAVISFRMWDSEFGRQPIVLGQTIFINRVPVSIVGVAAAGFGGQFVDLVPNPDVWLPLNSFEIIFPTSRRLRQPVPAISAIGRLKRDLSASVAQSQLTALLGRSTAPQTRAPYIRPTQIILSPLGESRISSTGGRRNVGQLAAALLAGAFIMLTVGCLNVGNTLITMHLTRGHELRLRMALGATRRRIGVQLFSETLPLIGWSAGLSLLMCVAILRTVSAQQEAYSRVAVDLGSPLDGQLVLLVLSLSIATAFAACYVPAAMASRHSLYIGTHSVARLRLNRTSQLLSWRRTYLVCQVAGTILIAGASVLCYERVVEMLAVTPGIAADHLLLTQIDTSSKRSDEARAAVRGLVARVSTEPGVESAALSLNDPFGAIRTPFEVVGDELPVQRWAAWTFVSPSYFEVLGLRPTQGRFFVESDQIRGDAVVVNEVLARQLWPDGRWIGRTMRFTALTADGVGPFGQREKTVVGSVNLARCHDVTSEPHPCAWAPLMTVPISTVLIKTSGNPLTVARRVGNLVSSVDRDIAVVKTSTMHSYLEEQLGGARLALRVGMALTVASVVLVILGCVGLFRARVTERRDYLALSFALGATTQSVVHQLLMESLAICGAGSALAALVWPIVNHACVRQLGEPVVNTGWNCIVATTLTLASLCIGATYLSCRALAECEPATLLYHT